MLRATLDFACFVLAILAIWAVINVLGPMLGPTGVGY